MRRVIAFLMGLCEIRMDTWLTVTSRMDVTLKGAPVRKHLLTTTKPFDITGKFALKAWKRFHGKIGFVIEG